jgi:hypothetical protein
MYRFAQGLDRRFVALTPRSSRPTPPLAPREMLLKCCVLLECWKVIFEMPFKCCCFAKTLLWLLKCCRFAEILLW